ncbi:MAG: dihydrofolate reductase [Gammaproteobacteria bacterium]|nr:dihydrofolate reductase [Gammaproteobacteria bacterium]
MRAGKSVTIIAAMGRNRAIGRDGRMPWHLPGELRHFKQTTMGKPIVMGRKTWESIGRALPGRQNVVVTRNGRYRADGAEVAAGLDEAIEAARGDEVMIIGGGELYRQALPFADRMILTLVDAEPSADTWFPRWSGSDWHRRLLRRVPADDDNPLPYEVIELVRRTGADGISPEPGTAGDPPA